jgi:hypothetical protein
VKRWRPEWSGRHVILPYEIDQNNYKKQAIQPDELASSYPLAKQYFEAHETTLRSREGGRWESSNTYWEFSYPRNLPRFELRKIAFAEFANESTFLVDQGGEWYFKSAYAVLLSENYREKTKEVACQLNSAPLEYYFKHIATVKAGGYYAFRSQYVSPLPCRLDVDTEIESTLRELIDEIGRILDIDNKTERFPEAYLGDYNGQVNYIDYEWQTRRYPVSAEVQVDVDDEFTVQAGRTDTISHPAMYSDDREARKKRAEYVCEAVNGRNAKSGEEMTIPIPKADDGVERLLDRLKSDRQEVEEADIDELEAEIDEAVYDLFDLTSDEREIVEEYLSVF